MLKILKRLSIVLLMFTSVWAMGDWPWENLYEKRLDQTAVALIKFLKQESISKVAVVNIYHARAQRRLFLSDILEDDLTKKLTAAGDFEVVTRERIKEIAEELKLTYSGLVEDQQAKEFGKLIQADVHVSGTYIERGNDYEVNLQMINVETGKILWTKQFFFPQDHVIGRK